MPPPANQCQRLCKKAYAVVDLVIGHIEHLPHGYHWWHGMVPTLGKGGRRITRKQWADLLLTHLFPPSFLTMLLSASILPNGKPNDPLYSWVLVHVYTGDVDVMYQDWFAINK